MCLEVVEHALPQAVLLGLPTMVVVSVAVMVPSSEVVRE